MGSRRSLWARADPAAVRRALTGQSTRRMLHDRLSSMLDDGARVASCHLRRARFKPHRKLSAYLDVGIRDAASGAIVDRAVAVTWQPEERPPETPFGGQEGPAGTASSRRLAPFRRLLDVAPEEGMVILVSPLDESFPELFRLAQPASANQALPPDLGSVSRVETVRYRPGQRHVLRYHLHASGGRTTPGSMYVKLYADERGLRSDRAATAAASWIESHTRSATALRPLAYLGAERVLLLPGIDGGPLTRHLWGRDDHGLRGALEEAGMLLGLLHGAGPGLGGDLPKLRFDAQVAATERACEHIGHLLPAAGGAMGGLLSRAGDLFRRLPGEPESFVHGDFKCDHLWLAGPRMTLMDFDSCGIGDPALDVGKMLADLAWWHFTTQAESAESAQRAQRAQCSFLDGYAAPPERLARAHVYEAVLLLRMAGRRISLADARWRKRTDVLVARADEVLARCEAEAGIRSPAAALSH